MVVAPRTWADAEQSSDIARAKNRDRIVLGMDCRFLDAGPAADTDLSLISVERVEIWTEK